MKYFMGLIGAAFFLWLAFGYFGIQALFTNRVVNEEVPVAALSSSSTDSGMGMEQVTSTSLIVVARGAFQQGDRTYAIQGMATITEREGKRMLSFTDFRVTNGPDLFVYLVSADAVDNETVKGAVGRGRFINLGALKGNQGNQSYVLPDDLRLDEGMVVNIWCRRFARNFGAAFLLPVSTP